ncbi:uncharacterized protein TNCT_514711 [Trichonephila clavata]|uniref:Uncharacterized protein n=1 Tax=Trichonephila clavata TaxID=2740835 RepID=A0A8X6F2L1_TRICU|nr:uncharacterized protein TNCT_514711 [Trichonephila clavata]
MEMYVYCLLTLSLFVAVGIADNPKVTCIHQKFSNDLGEPYTRCHQSSGALAIPKIKQCYQEVLKQKQIVKVANDGQMTVDRSKFAQEGTATSRTKVGKAMQTCSNNGDNEIYKEAARAVQCVFEELKKIC